MGAWVDKPGEDGVVLTRDPEGATASEYDLIVVGKYAVYTIEVKGYRGHIRGNAQEWELDSGFVHKSPIPLCNKKSKVVAGRLRSCNSLLDEVWTQSLIVLTDKRTRVRLDDDQADRVLHLDQAVDYIRDPRRLPISPTPITRFTDLIRDAILSQFYPLRRPHEIGDYRVLETIGKNNLYTMLLAEHRLIRTQGRFNLKVYNFNIYSEPDTIRKQQQRILRDANALHQLGVHPHIVHAHPPFLWDDNKIVLPLDWVDGFSLRGLLDDGSKMDFARRVDIVRQVCEGLRYAHDHGVIHRDIRPDNIIVPRQGPVKLVNFDCARVEGGNLSTIASQVGRQLDQRYVAPEVWWNANAVSTASDLYAAGTLLFELLTGQPPCQKIKEVFDAKGLPCWPTQINPDLPSDVDDIVARMCAFRPEKRYASLTKAIEDLTIIG